MENAKWKMENEENGKWKMKKMKKMGALHKPRPQLWERKYTTMNYTWKK